jgi:DNA (cytosine-5)-methyltransferase 1
VTRPRLLDLFCGAGGAAMGYHRAGFDVVGVDINRQPHYPFEFHQADAMTYPLEGFDVIHASPPCQAYSWSARRWDVERADLVEATRDRLADSPATAFVIENVVGAPLHDPLTLCGTMFGLEVLRHRLFECPQLLFRPGPCQHAGTVMDGTYVTVAGHGGNNVKGRGSRAVKQAAMGIDWMTDVELNEAVPPSYTEWIGAQLLRAIESAA